MYCAVPDGGGRSANHFRSNSVMHFEKYLFLMQFEKYSSFAGACCGLFVALNAHLVRQFGRTFELARCAE